MKFVFTLFFALIACSVSEAKWVIVDETGTVQDIASHRVNLSRGYRFSKPKVYEVPDALAVEILDKYDGQKVVRYSGTQKERRIELVDYAITLMEAQILTAPAKDRAEWQSVLDELKAEKSELTR